jgi:hypothetical protein
MSKPNPARPRKVKAWAVKVNESAWPFRDICRGRTETRRAMNWYRCYGYPKAKSVPVTITEQRTKRKRKRCQPKRR